MGVATVYVERGRLVVRDARDGGRPRTLESWAAIERFRILLRLMWQRDHGRPLDAWQRWILDQMLQPVTKTRGVTGIRPGKNRGDRA